MIGSKLAQLLFAIAAVFAQEQWCGKNYRPNQRALDPGGRYPVPATVANVRVNFRCWPVLQPFIQGEDTNATVIVDMWSTYQAMAGSQEIRAADRGTGGSWIVSVLVTLNGRETTLVNSATVQFNTTSTSLTFPLRTLPVQYNAYNITCRTFPVGRNANTYLTSMSLYHLPPPTNGRSVTKTDYRNGALLVKQRSASTYKPLIPFGFYTSFDDYLALDLSIIDRAVAGGRNMIHAVPYFTNLTALENVLERMAQKEIWLMFDMRHSYQNNTAIEQQVTLIRDYPYLLLWYTADEPDGWQYPRNSTTVAAATIQRLDPYHPVSLVLNCQDYYFEDYSRGASVIMKDTYTIEVNATYSRVWNTPCNTTLGDCGCDNCKGSMKDVADRVDSFKQRLVWSGRGRGTSVWSVPQAFGNETYWPRYPTGKEFVAQSILALNHGSIGLTPWNEFRGTPEDIMDGADMIGRAILTMSNFLVNGDATVTYQYIRDMDVDVGIWKLNFLEGGNIILLLATNYGVAREFNVYLQNARTGAPLFNGWEVVVPDMPLDSWMGESLTELYKRSRRGLPKRAESRALSIEVLNSGVEFNILNGTLVQLNMETMGSIGVLL